MEGMRRIEGVCSEKKWIRMDETDMTKLPHLKSIEYKYYWIALPM
jgi:hypothetical protein